MRRCSTSYVIRLMHVKQRDTTTHLLEWLKSGKMTTPNADKNVEIWNKRNSFIASGIQSGTATSKESLAVSYKTKPTLTI